MNIRKKEININELSEKMPKRIMAMTAMELAKYYQNKYGIKIIVNGDSVYGQKHILEQKKVYDKSIADLRSNLKYINYVSEFWCPPGISKSPLLYITDYDSPKGFTKAEYRKLQQLLNPYLDKDGRITDEILKDAEKLNSELQKLPFFKKIADKTQLALRTLHTARDQIAISKKNISAEIASIQQNLKEDEMVGYIFTNGQPYSFQHFEVLIITEDEIIKPVAWGGPESERVISDTDLSGMVDTGIKFLLPDHWGELPEPQATKQGCGTLGLLYLKELLKNNAQQLNDYAMFIPYFKNGEVENFFFPSPQVLRYSQSNLYNRLIAAALEDKDFVTIDYKNIQYKVKTLKTILSESLDEADNLNNKTAKKHIQKLIDKLPEYRTKWLAAYAEMQKDHIQFNSKKGNQALSYRTQKFKSKEIDFLMDALTQNLNRFAPTETFTVLPLFKNQLERLDKIEHDKAITLSHWLSYCSKSESLDDMIRILDNASKDTTLMKHRNFSFFSSVFRSDPKSIALLKELKSQLETYRFIKTDTKLYRSKLADDDAYEKLLDPKRGKRN